jgi:hypothetical protein
MRMKCMSFSRRVPTVLHPRQFLDSTIFSQVGRVEAALVQCLVVLVIVLCQAHCGPGPTGTRFRMWKIRTSSRHGCSPLFGSYTFFLLELREELTLCTQASSSLTMTSPPNLSVTALAAISALTLRKRIFCISMLVWQPPPPLACHNRNDSDNCAKRDKSRNCITL